MRRAAPAGLRAAIALLRWLDEQDLTPADCRQADIDRWITDGPSTRYRTRNFVQWAVEKRHAHRIEIPEYQKASQIIPAGVLADLLGASPSAADRWVDRIGGAWANYAAIVQRRTPHWASYSGPFDIRLHQASQPPEPGPTPPIPPELRILVEPRTGPCRSSCRASRGVY
ncbi:hypothetical protein ACW9HK_30485 [Nocardia gipuzkoensis]